MSTQSNWGFKVSNNLKVRVNNRIWRPVSGYEGLYEVSNDGLVRSKTKRQLKGTPDIKGYICVVLSKHAKLSGVKVHRLVASAFLGPSKNKQVNHKDANKANNCVENLEWVTGKENIIHAKKLGLFASGERNGMAKLSKAKVLAIRNYPHPISQSKLGKLFGVSQTVISAVLRGQSWQLADPTDLDNIK
jgi:hypothetical protein